jgi:hypothetical protein
MLGGTCVQRGHRPLVCAVLSYGHVQQHPNGYGEWEAAHSSTVCFRWDNVNMSRLAWTFCFLEIFKTMRLVLLLVVVVMMAEGLSPKDKSKKAKGKATVAVEDDAPALVRLVLAHLRMHAVYLVVLKLPLCLLRLPIN